MDAIREKSKNPLVMGLVGLVVGAVFGLVVLGWWIWPVNWTDATPAELSAEWQVEYLRATIQAYGYNGNAAEAQARYAALGPAGQDSLNTIAQDPQGIPTELLSDFSNVVAAAAPVTTPSSTEVAPAAKTSALPVLLVALCLLVLVLVAFLAYMFFFRKRLAGQGQKATPEEIAETRREAGLYRLFSQRHRAAYWTVHGLLQAGR